MKRIKYLLLSLILLSACHKVVNKPENKLTIDYNLKLDSKKADMHGYQYIRNEVADFREISSQEALRLINEKGSGFIYFGYKHCPFCIRAIPELNEAMKKTGVMVYYVDTEKMKELEMNQLLAKFIPLLKTKGDHNDGFYVPLVVAIKKGEPVDEHTALVDDFDLVDESSQLNDEQKKELQEIDINLFKKLVK